MCTYFYSYTAKDINNNQVLGDGITDFTFKITDCEDINLLRNDIEQRQNYSEVIILNIVLLNEDKTR